MKTNCAKNFFGFFLISVMVLLIAASFGLAGYREAAAAETVNYYGGTAGMNSTSTETINYSRYEVDEGNANPFCPQYYNTNSSLTNACAPVAGSIVVGFYDRYCTDLIPNVTTGFVAGGYYRYYTMSTNSTAVQGVINSLYTAMGTNTEDPGTSRQQYQTGLSSYATTAGYSASFTSVMASGVLNNSSAMSQIDNGRLLTLYITNYNLVTTSFGSTSATYSIVSYTGKHIYIAYRYKLIRYYNANNVNFRTDILLGVSTGLSSTLSGWYYVGYVGSTLDDADATYIY